MGITLFFSGGAPVVVGVRTNCVPFAAVRPPHRRPITSNRAAAQRLILPGMGAQPISGGRSTV